MRGLGLYHPEDGTFEVLAGSQVDIDTPIIKNQKAQEARDALLKTDGIVREGGRYVMKTSQSFKTPSSAAVFVLGGSQDGWKEWYADNRKLEEVYPKEDSKR